MQLFDDHVATIKAVIIQIKLNHFLVKKNSQKLFQTTLRATINEERALEIKVKTRTKQTKSL